MKSIKVFAHSSIDIPGNLQDRLHLRILSVIPKQFMFLLDVIFDCTELAIEKQLKKAAEW